MIEDGRKDTDSTTVPDYVRTLDTYIYRLRRWMRKKVCDDSADNYRIKREYEAAPVVEEIPPFGERFYFNEPIQGGTHFFSYVEQHINKYRSFSKTVVFHRVCPEPVPRTDIVGELLGNSFITPILGLPRVHRQSSLRNSGNPHDG